MLPALDHLLQACAGDPPQLLHSALDDDAILSAQTLGVCTHQISQRSGNSMHFSFQCSGNPPSSGEGDYTVTSGTAYTMVATLVQLMGEDKAFEYMKGLHKNVSQYTRSGTGPIKAVARGETAVSISFVHDGPGEKMQGFPVETITPSEGTGAEIGSMSIIKGSRNQANAQKFYDWYLTGKAQDIGLSVKQFHVPAHKGAKPDPRLPDMSKIKLVDYDFKKFGSAEMRKQMLSGDRPDSLDDFK